MIDMHCHILPGIDDGSPDAAESMRMLQEERRQGVDKIVFTPHFNPERQPLEDFLAARADSFERLQAADGFAALGLETKLGAEIFFFMRLMEMELAKLAFEGTNYLLVEFPFTTRPYGVTRTMQYLIERGYTPILAHVERYEFFTNDPIQLYDLVMMGCVAQVNAWAVVSGTSVRGVSALQYINWEMAHIISSDAHSMERRPPNTLAAYQLVEKKLGVQYKDWLIKNSMNIFQNKYFDDPIVHKPKKFLGKWK